MENKMNEQETSIFEELDNYIKNENSAISSEEAIETNIPIDGILQSEDYTSDTATDNVIEEITLTEENEEDDTVESSTDETIDTPILQKNERSQASNKRNIDKVLSNTEIGLFDKDLEKQFNEEMFLEEQEIRQYKNLKSLSKSKALLWGTVVGASRGKDRYTAGSPFYNMVLIDIMYDGVLVSIPDVLYFEPSYRFPDDYSKMSESQKADVRIKAVTQQMGANICFIIEQVSKEKVKDEYASKSNDIIITAIGNRVFAMKMLRDLWFIREHKYNNIRKKLPKIEVGQLVKANVISVTQFNITLEVLGVETRMDRFACSNEYVEDCRTIVRPGDRMDIRIRKINGNSVDDLYLQVSGRINAPDKILEKIKPGSYYQGKVDHYVSENQMYVVRLAIGANCLVKRDSVINSSILLPGSLVNCRILGVAANYCYGTAYKIR